MNTKTIMNISVLTLLLVAASSRCFAEIVLEDVSTNRARELGVTIATNMNGQAGVQVRLEFKTEGKLKDFVEAEFAAGVALGGQADRPAHEWLSVYQARKTDWFGAVWPIVRSTNGVPDLIHELSCAEGKHRELANSVLRQVYSDAYPQDPTTPTNSVAWTKWWEQRGRTNSAQRLWHNFDSHYQ